MAITSLVFAAFCVASFILYLVFPPKHRWIALLISSIAFYVISISAKPMIVFIILSSLTIWFAAGKMEKIKLAGDEELKAEGIDSDTKKAIKGRVNAQRKKWLVAALIINIGLLVLFKVFNYFSGAVTYIVAFLAGQEKADVFKLVMPLGISYYTFSTVGYILDIYWRRYETEKNYFRFLLYAIYFPHILQGPISRYSKLGQELKKPELHFKWDNFVPAMESILLGCFKKLVIADRASVYVSATLRTKGLNGNVYLLAMILDAIQIYSDFSGYMDIVSGVSKLFDVELEQNFNHPFFAKSVPEFWRRWHMSLGSWFKDYVYYPISVSKLVKNISKKTKNWKGRHIKNVVVIIIPVMVTWVLTGLWHGSGSGYVCWGIYYGVLIGLSVSFYDDIQALLHKIHVHTDCFSYRVFQVLKIFCIFMGGRLLGTAMSWGQRKEVLKGILTRFFAGDVLSYGLSGRDFAIIGIGVALLIFIAVVEEKENIFVWFNKQNRLFNAIVIYIMFFMVFFLGIYGAAYDTSNFMYQQF